MSVTPSPIGGFAGQFFDNNGQPLSGGKIYTYAAGTTTPQATYTSALGITPHANPIILDSAGRVPGGEIWLTDGLIYKFKIDTATDILIGTYDNITGVNSNFVNYTIQEEVITATAGQTVFNLSTINYTPGTNSLSVYIDGVNQYVGDSYLETDSDTVTFTSGLHVGAEVKFTTAIQVATGTVLAPDVGYTPPFTGGVATTAEDKLAQTVSVKDFGAVGDGVANDTVAIQTAIDSNVRDILFPEGNYLCGNLSFNNDYQRFLGQGAILTRSGNGVTFTVSARAVYFYAVRFAGGGFTGDNITVTGPEAMFIGCISNQTSGRAIKFSNDGGNALILGGIWNTTDATASGFDIEFFDTTPGTSLYSKVIGASTQQATGGVLINGQGAVRITECQIGKLTVSAGGGFFANNRIIGATSIQASINLFSNNSFAGNVTFGDGSAPNISQITFNSTNVVQSGATLTINSDVLDSSFHLGQLTGVTLVINGNNNDIWFNERPFTPTLVGTGSPSLGNGSLVGTVSREGRQWNAQIEFTVGSTTSLGSAFDITGPYKAKARTQGIAMLTDSGVGHYIGVANMASGSSTIKVFSGSQPIGGSLTPTAPFTWATGDTLAITISAQYFD